MLRRCIVRLKKNDHIDLLNIIETQGPTTKGKERLVDGKRQLGFTAKKQGRLEEHPAYVDQIFCMRPQDFAAPHECL